MSESLWWISLSRLHVLSWILNVFIIFFCQNSRSVKWQKNYAWRTELDLYSHYRYYCLEYIAKGLVFRIVHSSTICVMLKVCFFFNETLSLDWSHILVVIDLFQKLFRQDLLVASLFRNFLLAERIMRSYDCTPVSSPKLPPTYQVSLVIHVW